jgi:hypothetical protein
MSETFAPEAAAVVAALLPVLFLTHVIEQRRTSANPARYTGVVRTAWRAAHIMGIVAVVASALMMLGGLAATLTIVNRGGISGDGAVMAWELIAAILVAMTAMIVFLGSMRTTGE